MFDDGDTCMTGIATTGRRTYMPANARVRRLYCLECGEGAYTALPCVNFVEIHTKKHEIPERKVNDSFMVVERSVLDKTVKLEENLTSMFQRTDLDWGGAVKKARRAKNRLAQRKVDNVVPIRGSTV